MTTLICDFQSIVGKKIKGYATLTAGQTRPAYDAPSVIVHDPIEKEVVEGRAIFENVNPGDAVITVDWEDQSSTIRFVVPNSEEDVYLSDCLTGDYFTPEEIDLLRWGIKEQISGARELIESTANEGMDGITGSIADYFSQAAETYRQTLEAATKAEEALGTIDEKVSNTEAFIPAVEQLVSDLTEIKSKVQEESGKIVNVFELLELLQGLTDTALEEAGAAQAGTDNLADEHAATLEEIERIQADLEAATSETSRLSESLSQQAETTATKIQDVVDALADSNTTYEEGLARFAEAESQMQTLSYQYADAIERVAQANQTLEEYSIQLEDLAATAQTAYDALPGLRQDIESLTGDLSTATGGLSEKTDDLLGRVSALDTLTQQQGTAITSAKQTADKGVSDAAAALSKANTVNTRVTTEVGTLNTKLATAKTEAANAAAAAQTAAEKYAKEKSEADKAAAEAAAATEALRVAKAEASAAKTAAASDATSKADAAEAAAKAHAEAKATAAKEAAEATAALEAKTQADKARADAEIKATQLAAAAQAAAEKTSQDALDSLQIGGRNLAYRRNLASDSQYQTVVDTGEKFWTGEPIYYGEKISSGTPPTSLHRSIRIEPGESYTISLWVRGETDSGQTNANILFYDAAARQSRASTNTGDPASEWHLISATVHNDTDEAYESIAPYFYLNRNPGEKTWFTSPKLERGNKATDWTPAPEDVDKSVSEALAEATTARAEATSKSAAAQAAAEKYAKEKSEADKAAAEVVAAAEALRVAKAEALAAKTAAASDATAKADEAERLAKLHAEAQAKAAREAAEATAAADATAKANKAKTDADAEAKRLDAIVKAVADQALSDAAQAKLDAENKSKAAQTAAENYAKEKSEADKAAAEATAAAEALRVAKAEAAAAKAAAATDAQAKATAAETAAKTYAAAQATAAKEAAEATAAADATTKANKAKADAEAKAATLATAAENAAATALNTYKGLNDPKVSKAQTDASKGISDAATAQAQADKAVADAKAAADKLPDLTTGVANAAAAAKAANDALPAIRTDISSAKTQADKGVTDAADAASKANQAVAALPGLTTGITNAQKSADDTLAYAQAISQRGDNLIPNGFGELRSNKYFESFTYIPDDSPIGTYGSFENISKSGGGFGERISVDPMKPLTASFWAKKLTEDQRIYFAIEPYDSDDLMISPHHWSETAGTRAQLAKPLRTGDTEIHLVDADSAAWAGSNTHGLIVWNYVDSSGKSWPPGTYSRNSRYSMYDSSGVNGNVITLNKPWPGSDAEAGTWVGCARTGGTYLYPWTGMVTNDDWQHFEGIIGGSITEGHIAGNGMPAATVAVRPRILLTPQVANVRVAGLSLTYTKTIFNSLEKAKAEVSALNTKAGELTTGLSKAATQEQYNELNTRLWGDQGQINKLQGEINDNNTAFQNWQREVNGRRDTWESGATLAITHLTDFATEQAKWNKASSDATTALTNASAAQSAINAANQTFQEYQTEINSRRDIWEQASTEATKALADLAIEQGKVLAIQQELTAKRDKWESGATLAINHLTNFATEQKKWNKASTDATQALKDAAAAQKDINANNAAFQTWQTKVNQDRIKWENGATLALEHLGTFATDQEKWNKASTEATNALALYTANQSKWTEGANLAINNLKTFAADQIRWNQAATAANEALFNITNEQGTIIQANQDLAAEISDIVAKQEDQLTMLRAVQEESATEISRAYVATAYGTNSGSEMDDYVQIRKPANSSGGYAVDARGQTWLGTMMISWIYSNGVPGTRTEKLSPTNSRTFIVPRRPGSDHSVDLAYLRVDYRVDKATQGRDAVSFTNKITAPIGWAELSNTKFVAPETAEYIISFTIDWVNTTRSGKVYGLRMLKGTTPIKTHTQANIGPNFPWEDGRRTQSITWKGRLAKNETIYFESYADRSSSSHSYPTVDQRAVDNRSRIVTWMRGEI